VTEAQAKEAISVRWAAAWAALRPGVLFVLGNEAATPPAAAALFAAVAFGAITERQLTQGLPGARRFEYRGTISVRLYGPLDAGESQLASAAGDVRSALASQTIAGPAGQALVTWSASSVTAKLGAWWTCTLAVPFRFYDRH
jgi:hypothetical protein